MTDVEDLARRYLHLWQDYLTALMADLREPGLLELWIAGCSALAGNLPPRDPTAVEEARSPRPPAGAAPVAWGACSPSRWRYVASVKSPVLRCSRPLGFSCPK